MKIRIDINSFLNVLKDIYVLYDTYKVIRHDENVKYVFLKISDNNIKLIYNNTEVKYITDFKVEVNTNGVIVRKVYNIDELYNIFKNLVIYESLEYEVDKNRFIFDDGDIVINDIYVSYVDMLYSDEKKQVEYCTDVRELIVDEDIINEFKMFKKITDLKSVAVQSFYYYKDNGIVFNLFDLYLYKKEFRINIKLDIMCIRFIYSMFLNNFGSKYIVGEYNDKVILYGDNVYIEMYKYEFNDETRMDFINRFFDLNNYKSVENLNIKFEFSNYLNIISVIDKDACIIFDNGVIRINSVKDISGTYNIQNFSGYYIVKSTLINKILRFILNINYNEIYDYKFEIVEYVDGSKWLYLTVNDIIIVSEIIGDNSEM